MANELEWPVMPVSDPYAQAWQKALNDAADANLGNQRYFVASEVPNWIYRATAGDAKKMRGLPVSPVRLKPNVFWQTSGDFGGAWADETVPDGPIYKQSQIRELIEVINDQLREEKGEQPKSIWQLIPSQLAAACGINPPNTPQDFGPELPPPNQGSFWVIGFVPENTEAVRNGVTYVVKPISIGMQKWVPKPRA